MDVKIYETTINLLSANKTSPLTSFVPFKLTVDPLNCTPELPAINFNNKIRKIVYEWGDGIVEEQKFYPSKFSASSNTGIAAEEGDPRNFAKTHVYSLSTEFQKELNVNIYLYQFGIVAPVVYNFNINLKAPRLDGTKTSFFKNMHLVYTKMFDADNKILYVFEGKNPTWTFPVIIDWREKIGENHPIFGADYKIYSLNK